MLTFDSEYNRVVKAARDRKSPSVDSKLNNYIETQREEYAILDGRYHPAGPATAAPPIQIYHSVFADFLAAVDDDTDLEPALVEATGSLMRSASAICTTKKQRQHSTRQKLRDILEIGLNLNKSSADHILQYSMTGGIIDLAALGIVEEKFELGTGGDFTIQGGCSYQAYWVSEDHDNTRSACCCPSFIIGIAGPWIVIMGAVFTTQPIVQRLTDLVWLGTSPTLNDKNCYRIARVFRALKTCLETLSSYYQGLVPHEIIPDEPHPRFFPSTTSYRDITQKTVEFIYQGVLETDTACVVFLARTVTSTAIVVKFVQSYGEEAHTLLAEQGLAPKLLYCGDIGDGGAGYGGLKMVVMEYVNGQTAAQVFGTNKLSRDVTNDVNKAIGLLHQNGMVFGDLRRPNIMVIEDAEDHFRAKLIDFDWAGTAGQVHYPVHLSRHQHWADGVAPHQIIEKQHDLDMLQRLTSN
ncbi:hypothetical protein C8J56DRAFT_776574 [Mycena floridula]|nr:hypothetical protein C8J56DRAFT_776574 [Mycena floridula]